MLRVAGEYALAVTPQRVREKVVDPRYSWSLADMRPVARGAGSAVSLLIAPANFASQSYHWARAAETLPGVSAQSLEFVQPGTRMSTPADVSVPATVARYSRAWALKQRRAILKGFTHVLYEAELPILPSLYGEDLGAEIRDLESHGVRVGMVSHGSDIRTPSTHVRLHRDSPFQEPLGGLTAALEAKAGPNREILSEFPGPTFVSTPDLLEYAPGASWLPTLTEPSRWTELPPAQLGRRRLQVLHVPSHSALKGTAFISPAMHELQRQGLIDYVEAERVPREEMPALVAKADLVIDQVSMGLYGIASVEAMLAGRLAVAQAGPYIRERIKSQTGWDLPIIEAGPKDIGQVVAEVAANPAAHAGRLDAGRAFALDVHSQGLAASVLRPFLLPVTRDREAR